MANEDILIGTKGIVNIGKNTIDAEYLGHGEKGLILRNLRTGKEFTSKTFIIPPPPKRSLLEAAVEVLRIAK